MTVGRCRSDATPLPIDRAPIDAAVLLAVADLLPVARSRTS